MFDTTVAAARSAHAVRRRFAVLPAALAVHVVALGVVTVAQLWAVPPVPVPEQAFVPPIVIHIPPPGGGGEHRTGGHERVQRPRREAVARHEVVQPQDIPPRIPARTTLEMPDEPRVLPGTEGLPEGPGGGTGDGLGEKGLEVGVPVEAPRRVGGDVVAPAAIARPAPRYPELARKMRVEGVVVVEAVIDEHGNVVDARPLHGLGFGCTEAALAAIRSWTYRPATLNGRPVSVYLTVTVNFELNGAS
jgi:periplasmic protein TonB